MKDEGTKGREQDKPAKRTGEKTMSEEEMGRGRGRSVDTRVVTDTVLMWVWILL